MAIYSSDELISKAVEIAQQGRKKTIAVAAAQDADVIGAVAQAQSDGFLEGILVGDKGEIKTLASKSGTALDALEVINEPDLSKAAHQAVKLASEGKADAVMKGFLPTSMLLKTVLDRQYGLRGKNTLSHCAVLDIPGRDKLLNFTDGGMVVRPDKETKLQILENAVIVARALGLSPVRVAISATVKRVTEKIPHTISDVEYVAHRAREELDDIEVASPMPIDIASSPEAARVYGVDHPVAGQAVMQLICSYGRPCYTRQW